MDATGLSYNSKQRNPSNTRDARAAQAVSDWAQKRKDQLEKAKQLREERKYGSSHLQNAGENSIAVSNNGSSAAPANVWAPNSRGYGPGSL